MNDKEPLTKNEIAWRQVRDVCGRQVHNAVFHQYPGAEVWNHVGCRERRHARCLKHVCDAPDPVAGIDQRWKCDHCGKEWELRIDAWWEPADG